MLYDYHVAMSVAAVKNATPEQQEAYKLAVFKRYGIDETEFENSLKYYLRHTERLKEDIRKHRRTTEKGGTSTRRIGIRLQSVWR